MKSPLSLIPFLSHLLPSSWICPRWGKWCHTLVSRVQVCGGLQAGLITVPEFYCCPPFNGQTVLTSEVYWRTKCKLTLISEADYIICLLCPKLKFKAVITLKTIYIFIKIGSEWFCDLGFIIDGLKSAFIQTDSFSFLSIARCARRIVQETRNKVL